MFRMGRPSLVRGGIEGCLTCRLAGLWLRAMLVSVTLGLAGLGLAMGMGGCGGESGGCDRGGEGVGDRGGIGGMGRMEGEGIRVVVTIPPLAALARPFVDGFAGSVGEGEVVVLIPPGAGAHGFEIGPSGLASIRRADVVVYVGFGLEPTVESVLARVGGSGNGVGGGVGVGGVGRVGGPISVCFSDVVLAAGLLEDGEVGGGNQTHVHADGTVCGSGHGGCGHGGADGWGGDPHLWLDPGLMRLLAVSIGEAVAERAVEMGMDRDEAWELAGRLTGELVEKIEELDTAFIDRLSGYPARTIVVAHDAYRRWESRYGVRSVALHDVDAREATPGRIQAATRAAGESGVQGGGERGGMGGVMTVFTEPQLNASLARRVARQTGARLGELDPLGGVGESDDWFATMRRNLEAVEEALRALNPGFERGG